ncbi:inositol monophosphatase family protein [Oceanicella actignis]|uniref:Histidinol-phosphatase, inositol monophosphatase family n=1 Tax=Oceanicella actignis TaxID=1189325 RepID=A0A1M7TXF3_9RHOB|nr:inositol monophosphatase family protein [Oceanicella actignis]SET79871.1 histidinol-phosphatase, inositol monophosphatase family [Oceanicella actignis]SHN75283.1 histidinol-phosphatase, inositol monophosphatase family [Oceanicella actignis]
MPRSPLSPYLPPETDPESDLAVAHLLADAARGPALRHFRAPDLAADDKSGGGAYDPVTAADREAETAMRQLLARLRPRDGILGEEHGAAAGASSRRWVLDPIDGTRAYVIGAASWGVLVALEENGAPALGVIDQPYVDERFWGDGARTWHRRGAEGATRALAVSGVRDLARARLCTTFPEVGTPAERAAFEAVRDKARLTRYGLDCMAYALLAAGHVDLVIEAGLKPYDVQALVPVLRGAGATVSGWRGDDAPGAEGRVLAAATPELHRAALALMQAAL